MYLFFFNEGFCHEGKAGTFISTTHICVVYCSAEYICQATGRYNNRVWYKKYKICVNIKIS
jgi:hypothetical protein